MDHDMKTLFSKLNSLFQRGQWTKPGTVPFDPEKQYAVIRCSICTGEKVAGFKDRASGRFTEVMLIRSPREEQRFKEMYHLDTVKTEY